MGMGKTPSSTGVSDQRHAEPGAAPDPATPTGRGRAYFVSAHNLNAPVALLPALPPNARQLSRFHAGAARAGVAPSATKISPKIAELSR